MVNETPLMAIDAFSVKNLFKLLSKICNLITQVLSTMLIFCVIAVESTWP